VTTGLYFGLSAAGGLWVPPATLPSGMLAVAKWMPTYQAANLGWRVANGQSPLLHDALLLVAWTVILTLVALLAQRVGALRLPYPGARSKAQPTSQAA